MTMAGALETFHLVHEQRSTPQAAKAYGFYAQRKRSCREVDVVPGHLCRIDTFPTLEACPPFPIASEFLHRSEKTHRADRVISRAKVRR
jgi:hypothetical protein